MSAVPVASPYLLFPVCVLLYLFCFLFLLHSGNLEWKMLSVYVRKIRWFGLQWLSNLIFVMGLDNVIWKKSLCYQWWMLDIQSVCGICVKWLTLSAKGEFTGGFDHAGTPVLCPHTCYYIHHCHRGNYSHNNTTAACISTALLTRCIIDVTSVLQSGAEFRWTFALF